MAQQISAPINFTIRLQQISAARCGEMHELRHLRQWQVPLHGLFRFSVANHHQWETEESDKSGTAGEPAEVIKIWNIKLRC